MSDDLVVGSIVFAPVDKTANTQGSQGDKLAKLQAEIERLRARLEIDPRHSIDGIDARDETIRQQDAEIARLRAGGCARDQRLTQHCAEAEALRAENERLRAALQRLVAQVPNIEVMGEWSALDINITSGKKVRAEVDAAVAQARAALAKGEQP